MTPTTVGAKSTVLVGPVDKSESDLLPSELSAFKGSETVPNRNYFWGWIVYRDIFPNTKIHVTEFCQRMSKVMVYGDEKTLYFYSEQCKAHNCTDETCSDYSAMAAKIAH
jgi:hypothetical protein